MSSKLKKVRGVMSKREPVLSGLPIPTSRDIRKTAAIAAIKGC